MNVIWALLFALKNASISRAVINVYAIEDSNLVLMEVDVKILMNASYGPHQVKDSE